MSSDPIREALAALVKRIDKEKSMHSWGEWGELTKAKSALATQPAQEKTKDAR